MSRDLDLLGLTAHKDRLGVKGELGRSRIDTEPVGGDAIGTRPAALELVPVRAVGADWPGEFPVCQQLGREPLPDGMAGVLEVVPEEKRRDHRRPDA